MGRDRRTARHPTAQFRSPPTLPPKRDLRLGRDHSPERRERWASASGSRPSPPEAWGLHQRQTLGSVVSAAAAVSGLNDLTSHDPPSPGMPGSTRTHAHSQPQKRMRKAASTSAEGASPTQASLAGPRRGAQRGWPFTLEGTYSTRFWAVHLWYLSKCLTGTKLAGPHMA